MLDVLSIAALSARIPAEPSQGSFPPPALPGLDGTTSPSAICRSRRWPSRVRRWIGLAPHPPRQTSLVAHRPCPARAGTITPVEPRGACLARFPRDSGLPRYWGGSASTLELSRPARCSLTFRPVRTADPLKGPFLGVLQAIRRLLTRPECFRLEREFAGPVFHRGGWRTLDKAHRTTDVSARCVRPSCSGR